MGKYPWIKEQKSAMISVGLMAVLAGMGMAQGLTAGICTLALPLIGVMSGPLAGLAAVFFGAALPQVCLAGQGAPLGMHLAAAGYAVLTAAASLWAFSGGKPFFKALVIQWAAMALGLCLLMAGLRTVLGANLFSGAAQWIVNAMESLPNGDMLLWQAYQGGLASAPAGMIPSDTGARLYDLKPFLSPQLRKELAASFATSLEMQLYAQTPGALVGMIAAGGLLALCWPVCRLKKRGMDSALQMPAFEKWHLPRGMGKGSVILLSGYVLQLFAYSYWELYWGAMLTAAFQWIYMIQGAAYWEYAHKRMGGTVLSRRVFVILTGVFIPFLLVVLGILDQRADKRELREKIQEE